MLNETRQTKAMLEDMKTSVYSMTAAVYKNSHLFSDDESDLITSENATQTDCDLSPLIIKPKKYTKKRSVSPKVCQVVLFCWFN